MIGEAGQTAAVVEEIVRAQEAGKREGVRQVIAFVRRLQLRAESERSRWWSSAERREWCDRRASFCRDLLEMLERGDQNREVV